MDSTVLDYDLSLTWHIPPEPESATPHVPLSVFIIDTGWDRAVNRAIRDNLEVFKTHLRGRHDVYVLSPEQSAEIAKRAPAWIGCDPIIAVLDRSRIGRETSGFMFSLGIIRSPGKAVSMLLVVLRILVACRTLDYALKTLKRLDRQTSRYSALNVFWGQLEQVAGGH